MSFNDTKDEKVTSEKEVLLLKSNNSIVKRSSVNFWQHATCVAVALPTAFLTALSALPESNPKSPSDLLRLLKAAGFADICYGLTTFTASEAVLYFLNRRYLCSSTRDAFELLSNDFRALKSCIVCDGKKGGAYKTSFLENGLFVWSFLTSLIFAEMGAKAFSFLGAPGQVVGFSLSLWVYFSTRFAGARIFFKNTLDSNLALKQRYLDRLSILDSKVMPSDLSVEIKSSDSDSLNLAMQKFVKKLDEKWDVLPKDLKKQLLLGRLAPILGYTLAAVTFLPTLASFIPQSVQGLETLSGKSIGLDADYQNAPSFGLGIFSSMLTVFFYEVGVKDLPKQFFGVCLSVYEKIKDGEIREALGIVAKSLISIGACYSTAIAFRLATALVVAAGYASYLEWVGETMPTFMLMTVTMMLSSNLLGIINSSQNKGSEHKNIITFDSAMELLTQPEINLRVVSEVMVKPSKGNQYILLDDDGASADHVATNFIAAV